MLETNTNYTKMMPKTNKKNATNNTSKRNVHKAMTDMNNPITSDQTMNNRLTSRTHTTNMDMARMTNTSKLMNTIKMI